MAGDVRDTLLLPFDRGEISPPSGEGSWVFLNAQPLPGARFSGTAGLRCEQGFRPDYLALHRSGYEVEPAISPNGSVDGVLVLLGRNRKLNEHNAARAWNAVRAGGVVVCAGGKKAGIQSLRKWAAERTEICASLSKHHAQVFWFEKLGEDWPLDNLNQEVEGYRIAPGMFSADGPDAGSVLLAEQFSERISGRVADLGAGWGYLSNELLRKVDVESIDLFEADHASLEMAKANVSERDGIELQFHWHDVTAEPIGMGFDWVIMNPPFHTGRAAEALLGQRFIKTAASILNKGGRLLMVANTHLPYEQILKERFRNTTQIAQGDGFKVIEALR